MDVCSRCRGGLQSRQLGDDPMPAIEGQEERAAILPKPLRRLSLPPGDGAGDPILQPQSASSDETSE